MPGLSSRAAPPHQGPAPQMPRTRSSAVENSILARRPQVFRKSRFDVRHEQFLNAHPAARKALLIKIRNQGLERRPAAFNRIIPDLRPEHMMRRFDLIDDPRQADSQRVSVVHRSIGNLARPAKCTIEARSEE